MADQPVPASAASSAHLPETGVGQRNFPAQGVPVIHRINRLGLWTLYMKEVRRFFKVQTQTIWAPAVTTLLFLVIFTVALGREGRMVLGVNFATFVAPGLIVMGMMQNAFANASFSFLAGKIQGTIIDYLMPPLSEGELMLAMIGAAVTRAVLVGLALTGAMLLWPGVHLTMAHPWAVAWFGLMGSIMLALVGLINLPIVKFSVDWWNTLHQPASLLREGGTSLDPAYLWPLLTMMAAYGVLIGAVWVTAIRTEVTRRRVLSLRARAAMEA